MSRKLWQSTALAGLTLAGVAALAGCRVHEVEAPPPDPYYDQPPVVVYDDYYYRGYYDGPYYIWVDHDGHYWHERREEHEFRERERGYHRAPERYNSPERQHFERSPHPQSRGPQYQQYGGRQGPERQSEGEHREHH